MGSSDRFQIIERLFHDALERGGDERAAYLERACAGDGELRREVESLLSAREPSKDLLEGLIAREAATLLAATPGGRAGLQDVEVSHLCRKEARELSSFSSFEWGGPATAPGAGEMIGDYEILERIGGSMGLVFKARHRLLDKVVAIKLLPTEWAADSTRLARFHRELRMMGQLQHPNFVAASDARIEGRWHLVAMEFIEGMDLDRLVETRGPLPVAAACEAVRQAALGLEYAHQSGLIHRDIKPSNLMLTPAGTVKVIDMGIALQTGELNLRLTREGLAMGTVSYCAPEQFRDSSTVDIRADIYSLGCTVFHLLAGGPPYGQKTTIAEVMQAHLNEPFPNLVEARPDVPPGLERVLARMTAKDPAGRFQTPGEAAEALRPFAVGADLRCVFSPEGESPPEPTTGSRSHKSTRKRLVLAVAMALGMGLAFLGVFSGLGLHPGSNAGIALKVVSLQVDHFKTQSNESVPRGRIGERSFRAELDDDVQVSVTLSEPCYFYLLALNPDGRIQICWPEAEDSVPEKADTARFPARGAQGFGLTDGEGLQGFLVAASRNPLPSYASWRAEHGSLPWERTQAQGVWRFDGTKVEPEGDRDWGTRGKVRSLRGLEPFSRVCEALSARPEFHSVRAIAFPVEGRK